MAGSKHGRGAEQVSLRLPEGMRDRIKIAAEENNRSMNAEIIASLEEMYPMRDPLDEFLGEAYRVLNRRQQGKLTTNEWRQLPTPIKRIVLQLELYCRPQSESAAPHPRHGRAFAEGREAFKKGDKASANPYEADEPKYDVWLEGYEYEKLEAGEPKGELS